MIGRHVAPIRPIEIRFPHIQRILPGGIGDLFDHAFRDDHALRSAKAAKGGVRHGVGLHWMRHQPHVRIEVSVVGVKERPIRHRPRQVRGKPATRGKTALDRLNTARVVKADLIVHHEIMPLARRRHVLIAVGADFDRPVPLLCSHRGNGAKEVHLAFLAAKAAAHPAHVHGDGIRWHAHDMGDHMLRFRRVLRGTMHNDVIILAGDRKGDMTFKIHVILTANLDPAGNAIGRGDEGGGHVAALQFQRGRYMRIAGLLGGHRVEREREGIAFNPCQFCRTSRGIAGLGNDSKQRLTVKLNSVGWKYRFVVQSGRADVVNAGDVRGRQHSDNAWRLSHSAQVKAQQFRMRHVTDPKIGMQGAFGLSDIVGVICRPSDMFCGTVVDAVLMGGAGNG